jgi:hypothetical protein
MPMMLAAVPLLMIDAWVSFIEEQLMYVDAVHTN